MRRMLVFLLLAAAGCASSPSPYKPQIGIDVTESQGAARQIYGPHLYVITISNRSDGPITIRTVRISISGSAGVDIDGGMEQFDEEIIGGGSAELPMQVQVQPRGGFDLQRIDSLNVDVSYESELGSWNESGSYPISRQRR